MADGTKAAALAAALAEFDTLRAPAPHTATPAAAATVISLQSRRLRAYRVLTGVAAAAVVVVAIAALSSIRGNDSKSSSSATEPPSAAAEALPQLKVGADTAATTAAAAGGAEPSRSSEATFPAIDTPAELKQFASDAASGDVAAATSPAPDDTAAPAPAQAPVSNGAYSQPGCIDADLIVLGEISYQGTPAYAVRNVTTNAVQALDATDCRLLAEVPAP